VKINLIKKKCEIESCNIDTPEALHFHHIIERTDINTTNHPDNIAVLCSVHHNFVHCGRLKIIGVYPSTKPPNNRVLVYELDGVKNIDINSPLIEFKPKVFQIFAKENKDE
jgi:hypothetical protein